MIIGGNTRSSDRDVLLIVSPEIGASYKSLVDRLCERCDARVVAQGPGMKAVLAEAASEQPSRVVVVPFSFGAGEPSTADLAGMLRWARTRWPGVTFVQGERIASREHIVGWASLRREASCQRWSHDTSSGSTGVLVVGEGGAPNTHAEVYALSGLLRERQNCHIVEVAFERDTRAPVANGIDRCQRLGAQRIVVLPLALLDGPFHEHVRGETEAVYGGHLPEAVTIAAPLLTPVMAGAVVYRRYLDALARWRTSGDDGCTRSCEHHHRSIDAYAGDDVLPPRYRGTPAVSAASMRSAPLTFDADGHVAWDRVWQSFCDLALAGGPPHRGSLLEPPSREEVLAKPSDSARTAAEIGRGLSLITSRPVITDCAPGWVGLVCDDEEMAVWLLRAIVVENISVRREGATLFVPAGPAFQVDKEIKNVITAVAKTHHYWTEHRAAR